MMDSEAAAAAATAGETSKLRLTVKFGGRSIPVEIAADATIKDLKLLLQNLTNVLPRGQKLIFKGKVLSDESTLASADIDDKSKIMLMASQGIHQGAGPIKKDSMVLPTARAERGISTEKRKKREDVVTMSRLERWKLSGVIALSDCGLTNIYIPEVGAIPLDNLGVPLKILKLLHCICKTIPEEAWTCGSLARLLDVSHNSLLDVPAAIGRLSIIQKLLLNGNLLSDTSIAWNELTSLKHIIILSLNQNNLTTVPSAIGNLTTLKQLHIANNKLVGIPTEIGFLTELEVLKAQSNRLTTIPTSIGDCVSLVEVDLSCNLLSELPETFGNIKKLKALYLSNNGLKMLPKTLFSLCLQLSILDLHGTEITINLLRQFEGWESFDERRRLKHQKQLDFRVDGSGEFDEGADKNW